MSAKPSRALLVLAAWITCSAWTAAALLWLRAGQAPAAASLFLFGLSLGPCLVLYAVVLRPRKQAARKLVLLAGGLSILAFSILSRQNIDVDGFFAAIFAGTMSAAVGHTLVTLILGPLIFGRILCGWGCWRAMVLELLPIPHSRIRRLGLWRLLPFGGLALSVAAALWFSPLNHVWAGIATYYIASIGLAFLLRDERAYCKYLCPSGLILSFTSRWSLVKIGCDGELCNACGACSKVCPMDVDVASIASRGRRMATGQCILCQRCAQVCPSGALGLSLSSNAQARNGR